jgi:transposase
MCSSHATVCGVMVTTKELQVPEDLALCQQMIIQMYERIQGLEQQLNRLLRVTYGQKSETIPIGQLRLFTAEENKDAEAGQEEVAVVTEVSVHPHGRKRPNKELPRTRVTYDLPEHELACPSCGKEREVIGKEISEQYDYVPSSIQVIEHVRIKRACKRCAEHVIIAPRPKTVIKNGLATEGMLSYVSTSKYADHQPLNRLEGIFKREGAYIHRSTMCDWMIETADYLVAAGLYGRMKELVLGSEIIWTDDTPVNMQDREHEKNMRKARVWVYIGDSKHPYTIFDFTESWSRDGPVNFLGDYQGYLQADAFAGYECICAGNKVKKAACWAHARRKFYDAQSTNQQACSEMLLKIQKLYLVEKEAHDYSVEERYRTRQEKSRPLLEEIKKWLDKQSIIALPKSPLAGAVTYALNNWEALCVYLEHGELSIDNNKSERALRAMAVGRKNWLFVGSTRGGQTAAVLSSFMATCKAHNINPRAYLQDVLTRLANGTDDLDALLPDRWKLAST